MAGPIVQTIFARRFTAHRLDRQHYVDVSTTSVDHISCHNWRNALLVTGIQVIQPSGTRPETSRWPTRDKTTDATARRCCVSGGVGTVDGGLCVVQMARASPHRPQPGLQTAMIGFDGVGRVLLGDVAGGRQQLITDSRIRGSPVGAHLGRARAVLERLGEESASDLTPLRALRGRRCGAPRYGAQPGYPHAVRPVPSGELPCRRHAQFNVATTASIHPGRLINRAGTGRFSASCSAARHSPSIKSS